MISTMSTGNQEMTYDKKESKKCRPRTMKPFDWFLEYEFYMTLGVFTAARLFLSLSQSYMPFYVLYTLGLSSEYIAIIPLVMYVSGFIFSSPVSYLKNQIGLRKTFCLSCVIALGNNFSRLKLYSNGKRS